MSNERITTRLPPEAKSIICCALPLSGKKSMNSFILDAAIKQAKELIEHDSQVTALIANARAFAGD